LKKYKEEEHDVEEREKTLIILKVQVEEEKRVEEVLKYQLKEKDDICSTIESEIVYMRKELEISPTSISFEKRSTTLNGILNCQRLPLEKIGLGYNKRKEAANEEASTSSKQSSEERTKNYADTLRKSIKFENNKKEEQYVPHKAISPHKDERWETISSRHNHTIMYQNYFFGYFYSCNGFGHKAIDCRKNVRGSYMRKNNRDTHELSRRNYNSFPPLLNCNIICYNCNNLRHIAKFRISDFRKNQREEAPTVRIRS
jgi:hypothetical protein